MSSHSSHPESRLVSIFKLWIEWIAACLLAMVVSPAFGQIHYTWTNYSSGVASGGWDISNNWSPNGLPGTGDTADFTTLYITNASTISLDADQTNGNLIFGDPSPTGTWVVDASGTLTLESAFGTPTVDVTNETATIQATILGTNGFMKLGAGTLVLNGVNTYSGNTTNNAGTLTMAAAGSGSSGAPTSGPFGTGTLVLNGGTLNVASGDGPLYNNIIVPTGSNVAMSTTVSGVQLALAGGISGGGTINETGGQTAGTHLSGDNSGFTGIFNSTGGGSHRVRFDSPNSGSAAAQWNASANVTDGWGFTGFGSIGTINFGSFSGNGTLRSDNGGGTTVIFSIGALNLNSTFSGAIVANGLQAIAMNKVGTGTQIFSGNNTYNGFTTINSGVLQLGTGGGAGNIGSPLVTNNSQLVFSYNRSDTFAFPATLITGTGSMAFTNSGTGVMTLTGTNNESGDTTIAAGTIRLLNPLAIPGGPGMGDIIVNGTLDANSNSVVINGLSGSGIVDNVTNGGIASLTIGSNDISSTFSGVIRNTGGALSLTKAGGGKITLEGANTYKGTTTIDSGELDITTGQTGGGAITVASGGALGVLVNSASALPTGTLTLGASSTLNLSGVSSTTIPVIYATNLVPGGTVTVNIGGSFGVGNQYPLVKFSSYSGAGGFELGILPPGTTANLVTNGNIIALNVTAAAPLVWKGNVNNNWDIGSTANWTLNAVASTYADGQTVQFDDTANTGNVNITIAVAPGGVVVANNSLSYTLSSVSSGGIGGNGGITKSGSGTLTLSGLSNSYSGFTTINGGTVVINADNNLGANGNVVLNGGTLSAGGSLTLIANRTLALGPASGSGSGTLDAASGQTLTVNGPVANNIAGTGSLIKTGAGTLVLNGANSYSGSTTVSAGTLAVTTAQQNGGAITVNSNATLSVNGIGGATLPTSALTLGSGGTTTLQLGNLSTTSAIIAATNLVTSGTIDITLPGGVPALGEVPLIKYSGSIGGSGFSAFNLPSLPFGVTAVLTNDAANQIVGLLVQSVASYAWTGLNGTTWDIGITTNWSYLGTNVTFSQGSGVIMDDTALTNQLNLTTTASVFNMLVTNNALNYTIAGNGALSGEMTLTKTGSGSLTLANFGNNNFSGGTLLQQGTLDVRNGNGLGTGPVTLAGGTLENNSATTLTITNSVYAQSNTTSILQSTGGADPQLVISGDVTGSGTVVAMLQGSSLGGIALNGDNSGFTGTFATSNNTSLRFDFNTATAGSASANWVLNSTGTDNHRIAFGNGTISFGSLSGVGNCRQDAPNTLSILRIGDLNTNSSWGGTLNQGNGTQQIGILKVGTGTWTITASQPYTGPTTISNGILALANDPVTLVDGAIPATTNIYVASGAALDVSGRSDQNISLNPTQILRGNGTVDGNADNNGGGTIAPGDGLAGKVGVLTVTNTLSLSGTTWMKINRASAPNSDLLVATNINYGGNLVVTNVGPALKAGDTFTLFSSANPPSGSFTVILPSYYVWDTSKLGVNGTISVVSYSPPVISSVDFSTRSSGTITVNATNGLASGPVNILTSTNVALPLADWTPVTTNFFDGSGNYTDTVTVDPTSPSQFFILRAQ